MEDGSGSQISNMVSTRFKMSHPSSPQVPQVSTVLSFFLGHDSSIAAVRDGVIVCVLELERLFDIRYMAGWGTGSTGSPLSTPPLEIWKRAIEKVVEYSRIETFDLGVYVPLNVGEVRGGGRNMEELYRGPEKNITKTEGLTPLSFTVPPAGSQRGDYGDVPGV